MTNYDKALNRMVNKSLKISMGGSNKPDKTAEHGGFVMPLNPDAIREMADREYKSQIEKDTAKRIFEEIELVNIAPLIKDRGNVMIIVLRDDWQQLKRGE